jgi:hypothetical protein
MNNITSLKSFVLSALFVSLFSLGHSQSKAIYNINFTSVWNATDHSTLPNNEHWSKLVGVTHNANVNFWSEGETASIGIERIAEQGINTEFNEEVNTAISAGNADFYIDGDDLDTATGSIMINELEVNDDFSYLTLASMIAPSPDWMIGINNVNLRENDEWLPLLTFDLYVYDTGTDDGMNYVSTNVNSNPRGLITNMIGVFPFNSEKVGTLTITLQSVLSVDDPTFSNTLKVFPNPSYGQITISNPNTLNISTIEIYSVLGNLTYQSGLNTTANTVSLDVNSLNSGIYLLKMTTENGQTINQKLIMK